MTALILHIGTEKTGSTSIQDFLFNSSESLSQLGFYYPTSLGIKNHRLLHAIVADPDYVSGPFKYYKDIDDNKKSLLCSEWISAFESEFYQHQNKTWIISSEQLHSRLRSPQSVRRLSEFLSRYFDSIKLVVYLRKPLSCAISMLSTALKTGNTRLTLPHLDNPYWCNLVDHRATLIRWSEYFPSITVRIFSRQNLYYADAVRDFLFALNIPLSDHAHSVVKLSNVNQSLSLLGMKFLSCFNTYFGFTYRTRFLPFVLLRRLSLLVAVLLSKCFPQSYVPTPQDIEEYSALEANDEYILSVWRKDLQVLW